MNEQLKIDYELAPNAFYWFGAVDRDRVRQWSAELGVQASDEVIDLWSWTGGGEMFDSEMILRPLDPGKKRLLKLTQEHSNAELAEEYFSMIKTTREYWLDGLPKEYFMFEEGGSFYSAIRKEDGAIVLLDSEPGYRVAAVFNSVSEWYVSVIRPEFADMYGLPSL